MERKTKGKVQDDHGSQCLDTKSSTAVVMILSCYGALEIVDAVAITVSIACGHNILMFGGNITPQSAM